MRFEFDERKSRRNLEKHGIDFETAAIVFDDPYALTQRDELHEEDEERWITLGEIAPGVVLLVVHLAFAAEDGEEVVRLISARAATRKERRSYEEAHARAEAADRYDRSEKRRRH
jgi:uncharacterized DUF497 family protein